jgi:hypothetical protein
MRAPDALAAPLSILGLAAAFHTGLQWALRSRSLCAPGEIRCLGLSLLLGLATYSLERAYLSPPRTLHDPSGDWQLLALNAPLLLLWTNALGLRLGRLGPVSVVTDPVVVATVSWWWPLKASEWRRDPHLTPTLVSRLVSRAREHIETHGRWLFPALVGLGFLGLYSLSPYPGLGGRVHYGDSAEFQWLAAVTGVSHPSGYPLYLLLLKLFVHALPFLTAARVATAFSTFAGAGAVVVTYLAATRFSRSRLGGLAASLLIGVSYSFWASSTEAEVYALFHLLFMLVIYFLLGFRETRSHRDLLLALFLYAIGFGAHLLMIVLLPAIVYLLVRTEARAFVNPRLVGCVVLFILIGVAPYLYPYYISNFVPGAPVGTLGTGRGFFETLIWATSVRQFGSYMFAFSPRELLSQRALVSFRYMLDEFSVLGVLFIGYGISAAVSRRYRPVSTKFLLLAAGAHLFFVVSYDVPDVESLYVAGYLPLLLLTASVFSPGRARLTKCLLVAAAAGLCVYVNVRDRGMMRSNNEPMGRITGIAQRVPNGATIYLGSRFTNFHTDFALSYLEATGELGRLRFLRDLAATPRVVYATTEGKRELRARYAWERIGGVKIGEFARRHSGDVTVWVVQDAEKHQPGRETAELFKDAGSSLYAALEKDTAYVAVMMGPRIVFEARQPGGRLVVTERTSRRLVEVFGKARVELVSTTFGAMKPSYAEFRQGPRSCIRINGVDHSPGLRGIDVVALDSHLGVTESRAFDTTAGIDDSSDTVFRGLRR